MTDLREGFAGHVERDGLLRDAAAFGHNLAVTGPGSHLGHSGTLDTCPQRLCQRVRAALATPEPPSLDAEMKEKS